MARYRGPSCRLCRRHSEKLMLKGERCLGPKCVLERGSAKPGQRKRVYTPKVSEYGLRLMEKQKAKRTYGILERQLRKYFAEADKRPGLTGENLLRMLESRLDNVVYRLGFADSRRQSRQFVRHGFFTLNGRKTDIPSCLVKPGDVIAWKSGKEDTYPRQYAMQSVGTRHVPGWLSLDGTALVGKVVTLPSMEDVGGTINERLIVEFLSR